MSASTMTTDEDFELVDGELIPIPSRNPRQALVGERIEVALRSNFDRHPIGRAFSGVDSQLSATTIRRPATSIFLGDRIRSVDPRQSPVPFAPDIAIEVLEPTDAFCAARRKTLQYLPADTQEVWLIDYDNAEIFIQTNDGIHLLRGETALESPLLPGFSAALFNLLAPF